HRGGPRRTCSCMASRRRSSTASPSSLRWSASASRRTSPPPSPSSPAPTAPGSTARRCAGGARLLLVAIPDAFEAGQIVEQGRAANPAIEIIARAHSDEEVQYLERCGADLIIMG